MLYLLNEPDLIHVDEDKAIRLSYEEITDEKDLEPVNVGATKIYVSKNVSEVHYCTEKNYYLFIGGERNPAELLYGSRCRHNSSIVALYLEKPFILLEDPADREAFNDMVDNTLKKLWNYMGWK